MPAEVWMICQRKMGVQGILKTPKETLQLLLHKSSPLIGTDVETKNKVGATKLCNKGNVQWVPDHQ